MDSVTLENARANGRTEVKEWGGPGTVLNVGMNDIVHQELIESHGREAADALYLRFVQNYATHVARLDPDMFHDEPGPDAALLETADEHLGIARERLH